MKNIISGFVMVSLVACGSSVKQVPTVGVSNSADAAKFSGHTVDAFSDVHSPSRDVSGSQSVSVNCATSGSVNVTVAETVNTTSGAADVTLTYAAKDCIKANEYELDGTLIYSFTSSGDASSGNYNLDFKLSGTVAAILYEDGTSTVSQSADVTYDNVDVKITETQGKNSTGGTCETVTATQTGSIKIGGQSYTPSGSEWGDAGLSGFGSGSETSCTR